MELSSTGPACAPSIPQTPKKQIQQQHQQIDLQETLTALQRTPLHSIVASARKTGLAASPVRVPFALSPMALKGRVSGTPGSAVVAKEPSQAIKDAFLSDVAAGVDDEFPQLTNKRTCESSDEDVEMSPSKKKQKAESNEMEIDRLPVSTFDDLLKDGRDPIMQSPSMIDDSISRGREVEDHGNYMQNDHVNEDIRSIENGSVNHSHDSMTTESFESMPSTIPSHNSASFSKSTSFSKSSTSSTSSNPLLPSGIVKLLEKKRQESTTVAHHAPSKPTVQKKKFDLQESLKRPLSYKPHTGPLNKK